MEKIRKRIKQAKKEITYAPSYDYLVVNDDINKALSDILSIVKAERCRIDRLSFDNLSNILRGETSPLNGLPPAPPFFQAIT
jgi:guanylate kinase